MKLILPHALLFGYWGSAPFPWLMILSSKHKNNAALIAHESCHQEQQRRDGWFTFYWRYLTNKEARLAYEVEAYKAWVAVAPQDIYTVSYNLAYKYKLDISSEEARKLIQSVN